MRFLTKKFSFFQQKANFKLRISKTKRLLFVILLACPFLFWNLILLKVLKNCFELEIISRHVHSSLYIWGCICYDLFFPSKRFFQTLRWGYFAKIDLKIYTFHAQLCNLDTFRMSTIWIIILVESLYFIDLLLTEF